MLTRLILLIDLQAINPITPRITQSTSWNKKRRIDHSTLLILGGCYDPNNQRLLAVSDLTSTEGFIKHHSNHH